MNDETKELIKELKEYRDGMVARNLPFQWISDIITKWEMKKVKTTSEKLQDELEPLPDMKLFNTKRENPFKEGTD